MGIWQPADDRPDPIDLIKKSHEGRLPELIAVRVARMVSSPYGFLRGTAIVMAADVARLPAGDDSLIWPHRDGLIWPQLAAVDSAGLAC